MFSNWFFHPPYPSVAGMALSSAMDSSLIPDGPWMMSAVGPLAVVVVGAAVVVGRAVVVGAAVVVGRAVVEVGPPVVVLGGTVVVA